MYTNCKNRNLTNVECIHDYFPLILKILYYIINSNNGMFPRRGTAARHVISLCQVQICTW